jgi:hypothetical protein
MCEIVGKIDPAVLLSRGATIKLPKGAELKTIRAAKEARQAELQEAKAFWVAHDANAQRWARLGLRRAM